MVYVESGEHVTPTPERKTVARFDMFGFNDAPTGGFDPNDDDHVADLGCWDWEAEPNCEFPDESFDSYDWMDVLATAVHDPVIIDIVRRRNVTLAFTDHDGQVTVV
jgi:hypothetical protein